MAGLNGLVALVTGAASQRGIGRAIALELAKAGADVAVSDVGHRSLVANVEKGEWLGLSSVVDEITAFGRRAAAVVADVSIASETEAMVDETVRALGRVDVVVNNAAARQEPSVAGGWELSEDAWNQQLAVNLTGQFLVCKAVIPHFLRAGYGRIVNISSLAGRIPLPRRPAYTASKHGVIGLTRSLALDLAPHGITANTICPGVIDTDRAAAVETGQDESLSPGPVSFEELARSVVPMGRRGDPDDIGRVAAFLASPAAGYITGQAINIDGGWQMA
ncbi:SDR family NAD(P)-dependent oxidoreductase [Amycolatopsis sp. Poz14]|uniref:SDR family NAD(P)-dependent oxidoreductase n=1 Tax=Amycolatopsis sp. Poz14 TaxID=1447705 RepID=UPI001EE93FC6|nr:SDR family NAD(P)-dependent oxidoreductase [Amycolatopsis sp. Poz14]MCG3753974.1 SDR family oxidoreductase [Amycolatopsis sp. Poz14]